MLIVIGVRVENREDGGIRVSSSDLPGLVLSGKERTKVLASIDPAARAILQKMGLQEFQLRIDAQFDCSEP